MERRSTANNNKIDAVLSENDSMATGVVQALSAVGLKIPVSGQDGDTAALNRVALGTQAVSVWKNAFALGETAGSVAIAALRRHRADGRQGTDGPPGGGRPGQARRHAVHDPGWQHRPVDHPARRPPITKENVQGHDRRRMGDEGRGLRRAWPPDRPPACG